MAIVIVVYTILLVAFLIVSSLIFRHAAKFGYLSPRFKMVVGIFSVLALSIILVSAYLLILLGQTSSFAGDSGGTLSKPRPSSSDLNF